MCVPYKKEDHNKFAYFFLKSGLRTGSTGHTTLFNQWEGACVYQNTAPVIKNFHNTGRSRTELKMSLCIGQIEASTCPPRQTPGIWHLCCSVEEGIWLSESSRGWGIWSPCVRGGEFEWHPRFHVKSLAWRAIMGDAVLEDFRGKDCAFVANWLQGKA